MSLIVSCSSKLPNSWKPKKAKKRAALNKRTSSEDIQIKGKHEISLWSKAGVMGSLPSILELFLHFLWKKKYLLGVATHLHNEQMLKAEICDFIVERVKLPIYKKEINIITWSSGTGQVCGNWTWLLKSINLSTLLLKAIQVPDTSDEHNKWRVPCSKDSKETVKLLNKVDLLLEPVMWNVSSRTWIMHQWCYCSYQLCV